MWDLSGAGLEPVSPALAGRLLTTAPPGKPPDILKEMPPTDSWHVQLVPSSFLPGALVLSWLPISLGIPCTPLVCRIFCFCYALSSSFLVCVFFFFFFFWLCGILVPRPGIEPAPPAVEVQSLNHWTAREVPVCVFFSVCPKKGSQKVSFQELCMWEHVLILPLLSLMVWLSIEF